MAKNTPSTMSAADLRLRMAAGETLHSGLVPGERRRRGWWLEPSNQAVGDDAVRELRAAVPAASTEMRVA